MLWVFFTLTAVAIAGLIAYIRLGYDTLFQKNRTFSEAETVPRPYGWPDIFVCSILGIYFLRLVISSSEGNSIPTLREIEVGTIFYILLDLLIIALLILRHISPMQVFGFRTMGALCVFKSAVFWMIALYPIIFLIQLFVENLGGTNVTPQPLVQYLVDNKRLSDHLIIGFLAVIVAPFTEELIFRGYFYGVLRQYIGRLAAIIVISGIFAGIHQHLSVFPGLFLLSVALCLLYESTGCLTVAIVMHALFNLIGVLAAIFGPF